eukprot:jgi/Tetstr1/422152/TSEL_013007.t1
MSTSINTGMMNTSLANLARQSAIKTDPGDALPPPHFRDDTSLSDDAFSMDEASDSDSGDIQHIKPAAVKPTLNLKNVPIWDNTISTRDNAQAIKIALGSAGYLDTTKGKGTRQEQMMLLAALRHATAHYPMALAIVNSISMDSRKCGYAAWTALFTELQGSAIEERRRLEEEITAGQLPNEPVQVYVRRCRNLWNLLRKAHGQWTFEYVAINYLIPGLHPAYDHIVDATIPATNVTKRLATIISAGQNMEARTRQRQQRARSRTPTLNSCDPSDQLHAIRPNIVCSSTVNNPSYGHYQRAPAERHVNDNYTHNLRNDYNHQNSPQRQQYWPTQSDNDDLQRHHQPFGFVSPAGHLHYGHHPANNDSDQQPTGCQEAYPLMGVSSLAPHHSGLPVMLTCTTTATGGAATGAQEGEGEDDDDDEFHESWHVPYSNSDDNFQGSRVDWRDHRSRAFASIISFTRFYLSSQPTPVRYIVQNCPDALALPEVLSSFGVCNIVRAASCGSEVHRDTLLWTIITQPQDIRNCGNNVAAIKLADPGPFSGCRIYNPATGRKTPPLSMPAFRFSNADYLMDAFQPSGQQEGPHEGDATALSAPHTSKQAQMTSHFVDFSDYHPTLVAFAMAAVVRPRSARLTALALPAPTARVSTARRNYQEDISSTRPNDWKKSVNHEINSITTMALFVWINVPEFRCDNESAVIQQTAWAFAAQHEDGNIKREAGVIVCGNLLITSEPYAYDYLPLGCGHKDRAWHPVEALYDLPQASKAWFLCFSSFLHDFGFISSKPGSVIHLHRETCIVDILTTFHMTESKPRRLPCTLNANFHNTAVTYRAQKYDTQLLPKHGT